MSEAQRETSPSERQENLRKEIVDVLEHCYGPLFLSIGFGIFLTLDPAREVMVVYAAEIVELFYNFGDYAQGVFLIVFLTLAVGAYGWIQARRRKLAWPILVGFAVPVVLIGMISDETLLRSLGLGSPVEADGNVPQDTTAAYQDIMILPSRILLGALSFFYVPVALYWATGFALKAERNELDLDFETVKNFPTDCFSYWILTLVGRIPLVLAGGALIYEGGLGLEAIGAERYVLVFLGLLCAVPVFIRLWPFTKLWPGLNKFAMDPAVDSAPFGLTFVATFVVFSFLLFNPVMTVVAGPIAIASMFVIVASVIVAALTFLSKKNPYGNFPLILILVALAIASGSAFGAGAMAVTALILLLILTLRRRMPGWKLLGYGFVAIFTALWAGQNWYGLCQTAAGCNIIQGVEVAEDDVSDAHASVRSAFAAWKGAEGSRPNVTLIAAQGGGLFAGYHAAYDLAYRQDRSVKTLADSDGPTFADSIFAISGVSGGSFGAAAFWAVRKSGICEAWRDDPDLIEFDETRFEGCYTFLTHEILKRDYLSLSLSGLLFADNIDSILPLSAFRAEPIDRGHRFTQQFVEAADEVLARHGYPARSRLLDTGLRASWTPEGAVPLLFLNTTDLYTGERVVQSPVDQFVQPGTEGYQATAFDNSARTTIFDNDGAPRDLTVANAAVLSARFPIVSPPGRYRACTDHGCEPPVLKQIADGGYFDNTGLETIADILTAIEPELDGMEVEVISFSIIEKSPADKEAERTTKGTLGAPIGGVMAATTARRDLTVARFCERWHKTGTIARDTKAQLDLRRDRTGDAEGSEATHNFTVSWLLSSSTFRQIAAKIEEYQARTEGFCT